MLSIVKRSNTCAALDRLHEMDSLFGVGKRMVCPPQPKFGVNDPPPYMLDLFPCRERPKKVLVFGRFTVFYGIDCKEYLRLTDKVFTSVSIWRIGIAARYKGKRV